MNNLQLVKKQTLKQFPGPFKKDISFLKFFQVTEWTVLYDCATPENNFNRKTKKVHYLNKQIKKLNKTFTSSGCE